MAPPSTLFERTRKTAPLESTLGMSMTRIGIAIFVLAVVAGPLYTVPGYSAAGNLVSELAAQNTPLNFLMCGAFMALGAGIVADGLRSFSRAIVPFMAFGFFMGLVGLFGHKPINPEVPYSAWAHTAHGALATAAGISVTVAFVWQSVRQPSTGRRIAAAWLAVLCFALPMAMLTYPAVQGAIQRVMYMLVFVWMWLYYPHKAHA